MDPGTLFIFENFVFHDGESANKIIVVLGSSKATTLVVKTTSKGNRYLNDHGCQSHHRFQNFHLALRSCPVLSKPTWIVLNEFYELKHTILIQKSFSNELKRIGVLSDSLTLDLLNCVLQSDDINPNQTNIIQTSIKKFLSA
jgi:hypothetical protein